MTLLALISGNKKKRENNYDTFGFVSESFNNIIVKQLYGMIPIESVRAAITPVRDNASPEAFEPYRTKAAAPRHTALSCMLRPRENNSTNFCNRGVSVVSRVYTHALSELQVTGIGPSLKTTQHRECTVLLRQSVTYYSPH